VRFPGAVFLVFVLIFVLSSCGGFSGSNTSSGTVATVPLIGHVFVLVEENQSYGDVIGNTNWPYLNSLASKYSLATQYFADAHPSIPNYFMLTSGQIVTFDDTFTSTVDVDNIVRELIAAGKTWKSYAESLPNAGYTGGDLLPYEKRHNPLAYFSDVANSSAQSANLVPFSQFASDIGSNSSPNFSFIGPNVNDDAHHGTPAAADGWLQTNIAPLLISSQFQQDGLLIIVFDEGELTDLAHFGGHVAEVLVGPKVRQGYRSTTFYQHESTLRLVLQLLGVSKLPGDAANAPPMGEFFTK
jgi:phosphatidylinositol-3-phosphatase